MSRPARVTLVFALSVSAGCAWSLAALLSQGAEATPMEAGGFEILQAYIEPGLAGFVIVTVLGFLSSVGYWARFHIGRMKRRLFGETRPVEGNEAGEDPDPTARDGEGGIDC